eukprot:1824626-Rhodomonas_salina.1
MVEPQQQSFQMQGTGLPMQCHQPSPFYGTVAHHCHMPTPFGSGAVAAFHLLETWRSSGIQLLTLAVHPQTKE